jgi:spermidine synthase
VQPWQTLESARIPGGKELSLCRRGDEFVIRADGRELMSSRAHDSEEALALAVCAGLGGAPRVLVGGLGMGFSLRAALDQLPAKASVVVSELCPSVVDWVRGPLAPLAGNPLDDPRVLVTIGDVAETIREATPGRFDAILLDVDNGPSAFTDPGNARLYTPRALAAARAALAPGGALAIWSSGTDRRFADRLARAGFVVETRRAPARGKQGGTRHTIFVGRTSA